jgi:hypothetical protein
VVDRQPEQAEVLALGLVRGQVTVDGDEVARSAADL